VIKGPGGQENVQSRRQAGDTEGRQKFVCQDDPDWTNTKAGYEGCAFHRLGPIPLALATPIGTLRKTAKCALAKKLRKDHHQWN